MILIAVGATTVIDLLKAVWNKDLITLDVHETDGFIRKMIIIFVKDLKLMIPSRLIITLNAVNKNVNGKIEISRILQAIPKIQITWKTIVIIYKKVAKADSGRTPGIKKKMI